MSDDEEELEAQSYERYWWDCPACGAVNDATDVQPSHEALECIECEATVIVS